MPTPQLSASKPSRHLSQLGLFPWLPPATTSHSHTRGFTELLFFAENVFLFAIMLEHKSRKKQKHPHLSAESPQ